MNISERDKKLLLIFAFVAILFLPTYFIIMPSFDKNDALRKEVKQLQDRNTYLQKLSDSKEEYKAQIEQYAIQKEEILTKYPASLEQEVVYQFIYNTEQSIPIHISSVDFEVEDIDTSSLENNTTDASADTTVDANAEDSNSAEETPTPEDGTATDTAPVDEINPASIYLPICQTNTYSFEAGYSDFKDFLKHIKYYDERIVISKMSVTYSGDDDEVSGDFDMKHYAITGSDKEMGKYEEPIMRQGTANLFMKCTGLVAGEEENVGEPDFFASLCQPNADIEAKIIGQSRDSSKKTYVTSDTNDKQDMKITFEGSEGKYTATYSVGDNKITEAVSFTKSGKIVFEVNSSPRVGDDDKVSADIGVVNKTDTGIVAIIIDDDVENPRVKLTGGIASIYHR